MAPRLHDFDRRFAVLRQRYGSVRRRLPDPLVRALASGRDGFKAVRTALTKVEHASPHANLYHCCVHKTGSQWMTAILSDLMTYRHCGLRRHDYHAALPGGSDPRPIPERRFPEGFPAGTIVSPLYIDYASFRAIPKAEPFRAFFVMRDPRDVLVSWYFSILHSHVPIGDVPRLRARLAGLSTEEGLAAAIDHLHAFGLFAALRSWATNAGDDPSVLVIRYEDAAGPRGLDTFRRLYAHLEIPVPDDRLGELVEAYGFRHLTGRTPGEADVQEHLRSGRPGDWAAHLTPRLEAHFESVSEGLAEALGYAAAARGSSCG